jgi:PAS domain-containing protein
LPPLAVSRGNSAGKFDPTETFMTNRRFRHALWLAIMIMPLAVMAEDAANYAQPVHDHHQLTVQECILHADTFYWFAMAERGSLAAIKHGLHYVHEAEHALELANEQLENQHYDAALHLLETVSHEDHAEQTHASQHLVEQKIEDYRTRIKAIEKDLKHQKELAHDTHFGVFPIARFVAPTLFSDPRAAGSFELIDDPREVAIQEAVEALVEGAIESQTITPQFDVVFISDIPDSELAKELENEALYLFNRSPRFFVHNWLEVKKSLKESEVAQLSALKPKKPTLEKLRESFAINDLLLVRLRKLDEYSDYYFYIAEGRLFSRPAASVSSQEPDFVERPTMVLNNYGFCIDRRTMLWQILALHGSLLIISLTIYPVLVKLTSHARRLPTWHNTLIFGGLGFLWGRVLIWILAPMLGEIEPHAETLALWSFWWPAATGVTFILGPAIILGFADRRFKWFGSSFVTFNRGGALFCSIALGSVAYLGQCALIYDGPAGWYLIMPLLLGAVATAFIVGRAFDKTDATPVASGIFAGVIALVLGIAWCHAEPVYLWSSLVPLGALVGGSVLYARKSVPKKVKPTVQAPIEPTSASVPSSCQSLAERAFDPPFYESESFRNVQEALSNWNTGQTVKLVLVGPAGAGKSATLRAIEAKTSKQNQQLIVLKGTCAQPQDGSTAKPFEPFAVAIAEHFAVNLLAPNAEEMKHVDEALGGIFDHVVPFADILFPPGEQSQTGSKQELLVSISSMLRRLAKQKPLMLVLDDVHWMDSASMELLEFLSKEFPAAAACPLAILLSSRSLPEVAADSTSFQTVAIQPLKDREFREILVNGLGLTTDVADEILTAAGQQRDNLHWLFQIVAHVAQQQLLVRRPEGFAWKDPETNITEHLPDSFRASLEQTIAEHKEFRAVLECAACVGQEFSVDMISQGMDMSRLELIRLLDHIEEQTGIVVDQRAKPDTFAFRSAFLLEVLRKVREVNAGGPFDTSMPLRIREFHARLAKALEPALQDSSSALYAVANHYYAAGTRHADKALKYAIQAAKSASFQFQHDLARKYIGMAKDCATIIRGTDLDVERELLLIQCRQSRVEGKDRVQTATQSVEYLAEHPEADFDVYRAALQASYDAGIDTRDQLHFSSCVRIAQQMLQLFPNLAQQAEAYHFWGLGLPPVDADQRLKHLRTAFDLAEQTLHHHENDLDLLRLQARIAGSLAEQLSHGTDADRAESRKLFEQSIQIKQREDIRDLEGLAFAYGGLGRLAFFAAQPDYETARRHFAQDLNYSEKIGSMTGQTKMHSLLGACILGEGRSTSRCEAALAHYQAAHAAAVERVDKLFALAGLLECHASLDQAEAVAQVGNELYELVQHSLSELPADVRNAEPVAAIPHICRESIETALKSCPQNAESTWHRWLTESLSSSAHLK